MPRTPSRVREPVQVYLDPSHRLDRRWLIGPSSEVGPDLVAEATARWIEKFEDQRFSLTDATSFEVMRRSHLTSAFTFDRHFLTAGFALLE